MISYIRDAAILFFKDGCKRRSGIKVRGGFVLKRLALFVTNYKGKNGLPVKQAVYSKKSILTQRLFS